MTKDMGHCLGNLIENVEEVDTDLSGDVLGQCIRVKINLDILKPLKRGVKIQLDT